MNARPTRGDKPTFAGYVDLDEEPLVYQGKEYDNAGAAQLAQDIVRRARASGGGRPSLTGGKGRTPQVGVRLTPETREKLQARAELEHKSVSDVIRDAIAQYV